MLPETSSSSAFSSPSPPARPLTAGKSMEDLWQGINLGFLRPPCSADSAAIHFGILPAAGDRYQPQPEPICPNPLPSPVLPSFGTSLNPPLVFPSHGKRSRAVGGGGKGGEQWQKRRMKNRESADRSRARKQETSSVSLRTSHEFHSFAYTQELENEVGRLKMENAKLRSTLKEEEVINLLN
ncbi:unnamed protein product [Linum tenue]|uniref:BZIP domain-containing protein n=1 Tax=Linum tenue TaxID=586396 RepID=A0AAV0LM22_9ROSI|nr:unnamed protein product [Linum tenue]CAI0435540.1 unnamed protein product [Linum tenue]